MKSKLKCIYFPSVEKQRRTLFTNTVVVPEDSAVKQCSRQCHYKHNLWVHSQPNRIQFGTDQYQIRTHFSLHGTDFPPNNKTVNQCRFVHQSIALCTVIARPNKKFQFLKNYSKRFRTWSPLYTNCFSTQQETDIFHGMRNNKNYCIALNDVIAHKWMKQVNKKVDCSQHHEHNSDIHNISSLLRYWVINIYDTKISTSYKSILSKLLSKNCLYEHFFFFVQKRDFSRHLIFFFLTK